jgi:hypothetical protein
VGKSKPQLHKVPAFLRHFRAYLEREYDLSNVSDEEFARFVQMMDEGHDGKMDLRPRNERDKPPETIEVFGKGEPPPEEAEEIRRNWKAQEGA